MSKKNILLLYTNMNIGGAQKHVIDLAIGLKNNNLNVTIGSSDGGSLIPEIISNNIFFKPILNHSNNPFRMLINIYSLIKYININNVDIIHSHHRYTNFLTYFVKHFVSKNRDFISTAHNIFPNFHKFGFWHKKTICVSTPVEDYIASISNCSTKVIYNSIRRKLPTVHPKKIKNKFSIADDLVVITNIGRLTKQKSQTNIIDIIKFIEKSPRKLLSEYVVLIVGDGPEKDKINNLIIKSKLTSKIKLLGEYLDIEDILNISDMFILTSKWEGLPLTILEASSFELPILSTDVGGVNEVVKNNKNGFLFKENEFDKFGNKLVSLINDKNLCTKFGKESKLIFNKNFSMDKFINNTLDYYNISK